MSTSDIAFPARRPFVPATPLAALAELPDTGTTSITVGRASPDALAG